MKHYQSPGGQKMEKVFVLVFGFLPTFSLLTDCGENSVNNKNDNSTKGELIIVSK